MAPNIRHCLKLALLGQLLSFLFFGFLGEAFGGCLKLVLIHDKEVAGAPFGEIRLRQDVLHSSDRADFSFVIDIL